MLLAIKRRRREVNRTRWSPVGPVVRSGEPTDEDGGSVERVESIGGFFFGASDPAVGTDP
jgi:hypothetical protein